MISKKTINAIHVCVFLAGQRSQGYVTTAALSPRLGLSVSYLESILKTLRDQQIVTAMKGPGGGYMIPGDLSQISIWDIAAIAAFFALSNRMANVTAMRPNDEFYLMGRLPKQG